MRVSKGSREETLSIPAMGPDVLTHPHLSCDGPGSGRYLLFVDQELSCPALHPAFHQGPNLPPLFVPLEIEKSPLGVEVTIWELRRVDTELQLAHWTPGTRYTSWVGSPSSESRHGPQGTVINSVFHLKASHGSCFLGALF